MKNFVQSCATVKFGKADFHAEVQDLAKLAVANENMTDNELQEVEDLKIKMLQNKSGTFYKGLTVLPTGRHFIKFLNTLFSNLENDKTYLIDLDKLVPLFLIFKKMTREDCLIRGTPALPSADHLADLHKRMSMIDANNSKSFVSAHAAKLQDTGILKSRLRFTIVDLQP
jgi:hypothetical protein